MEIYLNIVVNVGDTMELPTILVNFKTYEKATGNKAFELAKICEKVARDTGKNISIAVQSTDIKPITDTVSIPVLGQHIDPIDYGSNTGFILPEAVKEAGASGTLINHSEHQVDNIKDRVKKAKDIGLSTVVCADTADKGKEIESYKPDSIAIEPPELIGGKVSVSSAKPELVKEAVDKINLPVLVGAGVHTKEDVKKAIELGAKGVLLASGVTKANNPEEVLKELCEGI